MADVDVSTLTTLEVDVGPPSGGDDQPAWQALANATAAAGVGATFRMRGNGSVYRLGSTFTPGNNQRWLGAGRGFQPNDAFTAPDHAATKILALGAIQMMSTIGAQGCELAHFELDGQNVATGFVSSSDYSLAWIHHITMSRGQRNGNAGGTVDSVGLFVQGDTDTSRFSTYEDLYIDAANAITCTSTHGDGTNDVTESRFGRITCFYGSTVGNAEALTITSADADSWYHIHTFRAFGTGAGVHFGANARKHYFDYLDAPGGVIVDTPAVVGWRNRIDAYDRGDGAPVPTLAANAKLTWIDESAGTQQGWVLSSPVREPLATLAFPTTTPDCTLGPNYLLNATTNAAVTINNPTSPPDSNHSMRLWFQIKNTSGGAMGAVTFGAGYTLTGGAFVTPATGLARSIAFQWNGARWIEDGRAPADYTP